MKSVFGLLAEKQSRKQDVFYRPKKTVFARILRQLQMIETIDEPRARIDRMWEKLLEIALFLRTKTHRKSVDVIKGFINSDGSNQSELTSNEKKKLQSVFKFLERVYENGLEDTRLAMDHTHFYTMVTSIIRGDLIDPANPEVLEDKLLKFSKILDGISVGPHDSTFRTNFKKYKELSAKQTTDASKRLERDKTFCEVLAAL